MNNDASTPPKPSHFRALKVLGLAVASAAVLVMGFGYWFNYVYWGCALRLPNTLTSPDSLIAAVVVERECRAGAGTVLYLTPKALADERVADAPETKLAFAVYEIHKLELEWDGPKILNVRYPKDAFIKYLERSIGDIAIKYKTY
jgi:hypothetical protein